MKGKFYMKKSLKEQFKDELWILYRESYFVKAQYILLDKTYKVMLSNRNNIKYALGTIFDALEFSVLLKLTKIYDPDPDKQSITLLHIFNKVQSCKELNNNDIKIKKYVSTVLKEINNNKEIEKIKICRDKVVSHTDKKYPKGLLSLKQDEQIDFELLKKYSNYAYKTLKELYELVYNETLLDTKQFEILELECEYISRNLDNSTETI